ncbi:hypothetical protein LTS17_009948 [Exophiala oligosperma]
MTTPASPKVPHRPHRHACSRCASRKIRCDRDNRNGTCSSCVKANVQCENDVVVANKPSRQRKRALNDNLYDRLARYEGLLKTHNIEFGRTVHTWVPSELEANVGDHGNRMIAPETPSSITSGTHAQQSETNAAGYQPSQEDTIHSERGSGPGSVPRRLSETQSTDLERCLWSDLSSELKYPPVQMLRHKEDPLLLPGPSLESICSGDTTHTELKGLHPEPRHIFRFWQIFVERVNPLTKIVHVPTLQQRILDASWDLNGVSKSLNAMLFAIYALAVTSLSSAECQSSFGESRDLLMMRYRHSALRALVAAEFLTSRDFEVLQAFFLFLLTNPDSELTCTLTAAAVRVGQRMGINRENTDGSRISFFEKEMRIRLWWRLMGLDGKTRSIAKPQLSHLGDIRLPLNVNDADLHPDMVGPPIEHRSPTEMTCVLMKYEVSNWLRTSPTATKIFENIFQGHANGQGSRQLEEKAVAELDATYHEKFLDKCDTRVPLHALTYTMAKLGIARMRFVVHHPRLRAVVFSDDDGGGVASYMTREDGDVLFDAAVSALDFVDVGVRSGFSSHLFTHMATTKFQTDVYVYVISELRRRGSGDRVDLAWKLVQDLYEEHPELIDDTDNTFFVALGDLAVEAWDRRAKELFVSHGVCDASSVPLFIQRLWEKRRATSGAATAVETTVVQQLPPSTLDPSSDLDNLGWTGDTDFAWENWNDFLHL